MKLIRYILFLMVSGVMVSSCANPKKMVYFQDQENEDTLAVSPSEYDIKFRKGDFLHIDVSGATPEAVAIFNPAANVSFSANYNGGYNFDNPQVVGYIVDSEGNINFPVIGKVPVAGKTKIELERTMVEMLDGHIDLPIINIRLRNFKVSVLGDVRNPGTFTISSERVTLPEAIGIAGDLNITAKRKVLVIRYNEGEKIEYHIDLTKKDIFYSPAYFLQQNDVVYVEPNQAKMNTSKFSPVYSILISVSSLIITTVVLITSN